MYRIEPREVPGQCRRERGPGQHQPLLGNRLGGSQRQKRGRARRSRPAHCIGPGDMYKVLPELRSKNLDLELTLGYLELILLLKARFQLGQVIDTMRKRSGSGHQATRIAASRSRFRIDACSRNASEAFDLLFKAAFSVVEVPLVRAVKRFNNLVSN